MGSRDEGEGLSWAPVSVHPVRRRQIPLAQLSDWGEGAPS